MPTIANILTEAEKRLSNVTDTPRLDAEILLANALKKTRANLLASMPENGDSADFETFLKRRLDYEPIAYILGEWEFYSLEFEVEAPALVPRPETEHLVEAVLDFVKDEPARVLELGTGTGCVAVAVAVNAPGTAIVATDINEQYIDLAQRNARRHHLAGRIAFRHGDLFEALTLDDAPFDVICSNPPYVDEKDWEDLAPVIRHHEDPDCLLAADGGLAVIRRIVSEAQTHLRPGGLLAFEIGMGQYDRVKTLLKEAGYESVGFRPDLAGIERIVTARKPKS